MKFIIETEAGAAQFIGARFGNCILGEGKNEMQAWEDAFGPKPWTPYTIKCAKKAWCREVINSECNYGY